MFETNQLSTGGCIRKNLNTHRYPADGLPVLILIHETGSPENDYPGAGKAPTRKDHP